MKMVSKAMILGVTLAGLAAGIGYAQQTSDPNNPSLGDIARELRAQKAKESKPVRIITNDDLNNGGDDASGPPVSARAKKPDNTTPPAKGAPAEVHDELYYRAKLSTLQDRLDTDKRELQVLQQKLSQNDMQYYPDPNKALQQQYTREDIKKLTADIDANKDQVADDEKAIEDLHDQLRQEGGDPGWLR
jgi:hypothetical protein